MATGVDGRTVIVGDVHGCLDELKLLLEAVGWSPADSGDSSRASGGGGGGGAGGDVGGDASGGVRVVLAGDLVGKGPKSAEVVRFAREQAFLGVRGNHDHRCLFPRDTPGTTPSTEHGRIKAALSAEDLAYLEGLPLHLRFPEHGVLVVHAGIPPGKDVAGADPNLLMNMRSVMPDGSVTTSADEGVAWASQWAGPDTVVFGHDAIRGLQRHKYAVGLDTGCCYGGALTAFVLPERVLVAVPALKVHSIPNRTLGSASTEPDRTIVPDAGSPPIVSSLSRLVRYTTAHGFCTVDGSGGNSAGVVHMQSGDVLQASAKLEIARQLGYSETVFISPCTPKTTSSATVRLQYFTPAAEVDLCGHATVASMGYLLSEGALGSAEHGGSLATVIAETKAGTVELEFDSKKSTLFMTQSMPVFDSDAVPSVSEVAEALCIDESSISLTIPPAVVSTGLRDIFVGIDDATLRSMTPDMEKLTALSVKYDTIGLHAYANVEEGHIFVRNFAPRFDIPEESATGTSNCALACLLRVNGLASFAEDIAESGEWKFTFHQGDGMGSPSRIFAIVDYDSEANSFRQPPKVGGHFQQINSGWTSW